MRFSAIISETVDHQFVGSGEVTVYRDPSVQQAVTLLKRHKEMRGLEHDGMILIWNSYDAVHFQIEAAYGLRGKECAEFSVRLFDEPADVTLFTHKDRLSANPWFMRLLHAVPHVIIGGAVQEAHVDDLLVSLRRAKDQLARLTADRDDLHRRHMAASDEKYLRMRAYGSKIGKLMSQRHIALADQIEQLKAHIVAERQAGLLSAVFIKYASQLTDYENRYLHALGQMIDQADANLDHPAGSAIDRFVGHGYSKSPDEGMAGIMQEQWLEDAYSPTPSTRGQLIRAQLTKAFAPIAQALRAMFGETVTLYRAQGAVTRTRYCLSYTGYLKIAGHFMSSDKTIHTKEFPIDQIIWITDRANQQEFIMRVA